MPGVGTFENAMAYLTNNNLVPVLQSHVDRGGRLLGICLGMQLLFESSEESPGVMGLALLRGACVQFPLLLVLEFHTSNHLIAPDGYNSNSDIYDFSTSSGYSFADYYFVHSYVVEPSSSSVISACFQHPEGALCASVASSNVFGVQFHPEKSGADGYALLDRLLGSTTSV